MMFSIQMVLSYKHFVNTPKKSLKQKIPPQKNPHSFNCFPFGLRGKVPPDAPETLPSRPIGTLMVQVVDIAGETQGARMSPEVSK